MDIGWGGFFAVVFYVFRGIIFGFTKSVVILSADIFGMMGKLTYAILTGLGVLSYYPASKALDFASYYAYKWYEESYYMRDEDPPKEVIERRAEDENLSVEEYKRKFKIIERYYNSKLARIVSYPVSAVTYSSGKVADEGKEVLDWMANWGIVAGIIVGMLFFVWLLIKWRR